MVIKSRAKKAYSSMFHNKFRWNHVSLALGTSIIAFLIGTLAVIYFPDRNSLFFSGQIDIQDDIDVSTGETSWWIYPELEPYQIHANPQFNWPVFWSVLKNHTIVNLEGYNPNTEEWMIANSLLTINRNYTSDNNCKIGFEFTTPDNGVTTDWRLTLAIDTRVKSFVNRSGTHEYTLQFEHDGYLYNVSFNWSDMLQYSGLIFNHGIKNIDGDDYFWFRVRRNNVPPNFFVNLDPQYTIESSVGDLRISFTSMRSIGRQSNGTLWVTYVEYDLFDTYVAYSENEGVTWNEIEIANSNRGCSYSSIAVDSNDTVHIVYSELPTADTYYNLNHTDSSDWFSTHTTINDGTDYEYYGALAVDSADNLHLVCEKSDEGASNDDQVAYYKSVDNGATWSNANVLTNEANSADDMWYPSIAIDRNDTIHVGYMIEDYSALRDVIYHMYSSDEGVSWSGWTDDEMMEEVNPYFGYPCLAICDNDTLHCVAYDNYLDSEAKYAYNISSSWSEEEDVEVNAIKPSIAIDANETCYILMIADGGLGAYDINGTYGDWGAFTYLSPNQQRVSTLHAQFPIINGVRTNRPVSGYCGVYVDHDTALYYYADSALDWEEEEEVAENTPPTLAIQYPKNQSENVSIQPTIQVWANDTDTQDIMNVTFYDNSTLTVSGYEGWGSEVINASATGAEWINMNALSVSAVGVSYMDDGKIYYTQQNGTKDTWSGKIEEIGPDMVYDAGNGSSTLSMCLVTDWNYSELIHPRMVVNRYDNHSLIYIVWNATFKRWESHLIDKNVTIAVNGRQTIWDVGIDAEYSNHTAVVYINESGHLNYTVNNGTDGSWRGADSTTGPDIIANSSIYRFIDGISFWYFDEVPYISFTYDHLTYAGKRQCGYATYDNGWQIVDVGNAIGRDEGFGEANTDIWVGAFPLATTVHIYISDKEAQNIYFVNASNWADNEVYWDEYSNYIAVLGDINSNLFSVFDTTFPPTRVITGFNFGGYGWNTDTIVSCDDKPTYPTLDACWANNTPISVFRTDKGLVYAHNNNTNLPDPEVSRIFIERQVNITADNSELCYWKFVNANEYYKKYWFAVNVSDGTDYVNETYNFRVEPYYTTDNDIHIFYNWQFYTDDDVDAGDGTVANPHIIQNKIRNNVYIWNVTEHFKIRNCEFNRTRILNTSDNIWTVENCQWKDMNFSGAFNDKSLMLLWSEGGLVANCTFENNSKPHITSQGFGTVYVGGDCDNTVFRNCTWWGNPAIIYGTTPQKNDVFLEIKSENITVENCKFYDAYLCTIIRTDNVSVYNCTYNMSYATTECDDSVVSHGAYTTIDNCTFKNGQEATEISKHKPGFTVSNCSFDGSYTACWAITQQSGVRIEDLLFENNTVNNSAAYGVWLGDTYNSTIQNNYFDNCSNYSAIRFGFLWNQRIEYAKLNTVKNNFFNNNNYSIFDSYGDYNIIFNNSFKNSGKHYGSLSPYDTNIMNITKVELTAPDKNIIGGLSQGGNYWDNYTGMDTDGDGLGDTETPVYMDYLPLTNNQATWQDVFWWDMSYSNISEHIDGFWWDMSYSNISDHIDGFWWDMSYSNISDHIDGFWWDFGYSNTSEYLDTFWWDFNYSNTSVKQYQNNFWWDFNYSNTSILDIIIIKDEYPSDNSFGIPLQPAIFATIEHINGTKMNITFYYNGSTVLQTYTNVSNGTYTTQLPYAVSRFTKYNYSIHVEDYNDTDIQGEYIFRTEHTAITGDFFNTFYWFGILGIFGLLTLLGLKRKKIKKKQR